MAPRSLELDVDLAASCDGQNVRIWTEPNHGMLLVQIERAAVPAVSRLVGVALSHRQSWRRVTWPVRQVIQVRVDRRPALELLPRRNWIGRLLRVNFGVRILDWAAAWRLLRGPR